MKILIIDRDPLATQLLQNRLQQMGHEVVAEPVRKTALEKIGQEAFDMIMIDPAPLPSVRQVTLPLRWEQAAPYFYIMQISHSPEPDEIVQAGLNDAIAKPFDWQEVEAKVANAQRLVGLMRHLHDTPDVSANEIVIFGKHALYQLMLSALDRSYRYDEKTFLMLIQVRNVQSHIKGKLEKYLSTLHRRSDFLGHIADTDYALLILRPAVSSEPLDAVDRFGIALREFQQGLSLAEQPQFLIQLWALPSAQVLREYALGG